MSICTLWIDRSHAKIFEFSNEKMERRVVEAGHAEREFFRSVAALMSGSDRVLVLGPGVAKHHFCTYLTEQIPALARKLVGCQTVEQPSDQQIAAITRKFFNLNGYSA